jgi:hypothetical protein
LRLLTLEADAPAVPWRHCGWPGREGGQHPHDIQHEDDETKALVTTFSESGHALEDIKMPATPKLQQIRAWEPKSFHWRRLHAVPPPEHWNRVHQVQVSWD